jgi:type III secretion protein T
MLDIYFDLLLTNPGYLVAIFFLVLCRVLPIIATAPFFGAKLMPQPVRVTLAAALTIMFLPHLMQITTPDLSWNPALIGLAIKETMVGFFLGFLVSMPFNIAQMSGIVIDNQRGSSSMVGSDPVLSNQVSTIGMFYNFFTIVVFFSLDGPFLFIDGIYKSYTVLHPDQYPPADFFLHSSNVFWTYMIGLMGKVFAISVQLAAPPLVAILMADVFLGIVNRLAPQIQISFLGMGLKAYTGDLVLWAAWLFIVEQLGSMSIKWVKDMNDLLERLPI